MSGATERENEVARLRKDLESLNAMAHSGLPVAEALAEAERRLSAIEAQQVKAEKVDGDVVAGTKETGIDQRRQQVGTQVNVARLYQIYQATPGHDELTDEDFQRVLDDYLSWVEREYGSARLHGLQSLQQTGAVNSPLAQVYTSLIATHRPAVTPGGEAVYQRKRGARAGDLAEEHMGSEEARPVDMADLLTLGNRVAIVGGAGSGKTTIFPLQVPPWLLAFVANRSTAGSSQSRRTCRSRSLSLPLFVSGRSTGMNVRR